MYFLFKFLEEVNCEDELVQNDFITATCAIGFFAYLLVYVSTYQLFLFFENLCIHQRHPSLSYVHKSHFLPYCLRTFEPTVFLRYIIPSQ